MRLTKRVLIGIGLFIAFIGSGACEVKVGGKTAQEVFPDPKVAALADAAAAGRVSEVEHLLKSGVPVDGLGDQRTTPLLFALFARNLPGAEALLKGGANPNHCITSPQEVGGRPIALLFASTEAVDLMELLLKYGADPNTKNPERINLPGEYTIGDSLLAQAVMYKPMVESLVKYGADVNSKSKAGVTPIDEAASLGQLDVVDFLLDHGADSLDSVAQRLQERTWVDDAQPHRIKILERLHAKGVTIYAAKQNPQTPSYLISPGEWPHEPFKKPPERKRRTE